MAVRIPIIEQTTGVSTSMPTPQARAVGSENSLGQGLLQAGQALAGFNRMLEHQADQDARAWTTNALPDLTMKAQSMLQQQKETAKEGAADFTPQYLDQFDKLTQDSLQNAPNDASKKYLAQHMQSLRIQLGGQAMHFEANSRMAWRADTVKNGIEKWAVEVGAGRADYNVALNAIKETMPDVGPEMRTKLEDLAKKSFSNAKAATEVLNNPGELKRQIDWILNVRSLKDAAASSGIKSDALAIATAIYGQESGGGKADTSGVNSQNVTGPMQMQEGTFNGMKKLGLIPDTFDWKNPEQNKEAGFRWVQYLSDKYNGDPEKVAAAYYAGEKAVTADGKIHREWKNRERPNDPTVGQYIDQVMGRMGKGNVKLASSDTGTMTDAMPDNGGSTAPWLADMSYQELLHYRQQADAQVQRFNQEQQSSLRLATQNAEAMAQAGVAPNDPPRSREEFAAAFKDPVIAEQEYQRYATARQTATTVAGYQTKSTAELADVLDGTKAQKLFGPTDPSDPAFAVKERNRMIAQQAAAQVIQARQADPWGYAIQNKEFGAAPVDPTSKDFMDSLKNRAANMDGMMRKYGVAPTLLSKAETTALAERFGSLPGAERIDMLKQIRGAIADDGVYTHLMDSIRKDSPVTAMAGNIAAVGGNLTVGDKSIPVDEVARRIAVGEDLLNKTKAVKGTDGNKGGFPMPKEDQLAQSFNDAVGTAYAGFPEARAHAYEAYRAYYAATAAQQGLFDPKAGVDDKIAKEAVAAATGGVTDWGGHWYGGARKLILPYGMTASDFKDRMDSMWKTIGPANGYKKTGTGDIGLMPTGQNGVYQVMSGTSWLPGKDGKPILLDVVKQSVVGSN